MLPRATATRTAREAAKGKQSGRTLEIQRLIGRSLRTAVDLQTLGERSVIVDCDVIQADGGTRTASITGAYVALMTAIQKLLQMGTLKKNPIVDSVAATSVGIVNGVPLLDLNYEEDSRAAVDMNIVMMGAGRFVELQATGERAAFGDSELASLIELGRNGVKGLLEIQGEGTAAAVSFIAPRRIRARLLSSGSLDLRTLLLNPLQVCAIFLFARRPESRSKRMRCRKHSTMAFIKKGVRGRLGVRSGCARRRSCVYSARFSGSDATDESNNRLLIDRLGSKTDRTGRYVCVIALTRAGELVKTFRGMVEGEILPEPRGMNGFGYDPLFYYPPFGATFGEVSASQKQTVSHRGAALKQLAAYLKSEQC